MKPNICVLSEMETHCDDVVVAEWRAANNKHYSLCLFQHDNPTPIACWDQANVGKAEFKKTIAITTVFELRDVENQTLLGQQSFQVINAQKKLQRARRNPWSFF